MTSKISFSKMTGQDFKRRIWVSAIILLGFFVILPLTGLIKLETILQQLADGILQTSSAVQRIENWIGPANEMTSIWVVVSAVLCGFTGFSYLHSRSKLDLYHSIPVRREKLFFSQYVSGLCSFLIPFILCEVFSLLVCLIRGVLTAELAAVWGSSLIVHCVNFLVFYHVAILAVMLTGRMLVSVLGMLVFWGYVPLLMVVFQSYTASFFDSYYQMYGNTSGVVKILSCFSPISLCFNESFLSYTGLNAVTTGSWWTSMLVTILMAGILLAAVVIIYKKRPSEAAGRSMAFAKTESPIKIFLLVPMAMAGGLILRSVSYSQSDIWLFFGILFGLLVSHGIIEVIYHYDIRKVFSRKVSLALAGAAVLIVTVVYRVDLFGYDNYIPNENLVASAAVSIEDMHTGIEYMEYKEENGHYSYTDPTTYRLGHMELEKISDVLDIARAGIRNLNDKTEPDENTSFSYVTVKYNLNNGKEVYRQYRVELDGIEKQLESLYSSTEYKKAQFPLTAMDTSLFGKVYVSDIMRNESMLSVSSSDAEKIIKTYCRELEQITYAKMKEQPAIGSLRFEVTEQPEVYLDSMIYPVYPFFEETLELLENAGCELPEKIDPEKVKKIEVTRYVYESYPDEQILNDTVEKVYDDEKSIEEILNGLASAYDYSFDMDINWEVAVTMRNQYDEEETQYYSFRKGAVPSFIEEE